MICGSALLAEPFLPAGSGTDGEAGVPQQWGPPNSLQR